MRTTFDNVLSDVVRTCELHPDFGKIKEVTVVRDLKGCVRLVVQPVADEKIDTESLKSAIVAEVGGYFKPPILMTDSQRPDEKRLATELFRHADPWSPDYEDPTSGAVIPASATQWKKLERRLSKQAWVDKTASNAAPPWPLQSGHPGIVTFYSFKGGVGRSTALISVAWQFASMGKRVCVVDLDLEAPGLGALLGAEPARGVLDFLVDFVATGNADLSDSHVPAAVMGNDAGNVDVIPAGRINLAYLEKLSRLDFAGTQTFEHQGSPVQQALKRLLGKIHHELKPDYILLDSRAGLHDIAGLSLHGLAHVDVIVGRASEQSYAGLELTLRALSLRKDIDQLMTVMVHAFAPPDEQSPEGTAERTEYRSRLYSMFLEYIYKSRDDDDAEDAPQEEDTVAAHTPIVLSSNPYLERFNSLAAGNTRAALFGPDYQALASRIEELCNATDQEDDEP